MEISHSEFTIHDLIGMFQRKELIINKEYQRNPGVWPATAKTYFIDTILEEFPFPKIYLYQNYDKAGKRPYKEIVDGQQRFTAINEFYTNKLTLTSLSKNYGGSKFEDLGEDIQQLFLTSRIQADVILSADKSAILELFRRMNSYTAPLNDSEKRNAEFQGQFKWYINELSKRYAVKFQEWSIFSPRDIIRMKDMEFLTDLSLLIDSAQVTSRSPSNFRKLYTKYDEEFQEKNRFTEIVTNTLDAIFGLDELKESHMCKEYAIYSLFGAFAHARYGILGGETGIPQISGRYYSDRTVTSERLLGIAAAHENKDTTGKYALYVDASLKTTTKRQQRLDRIKIILENIQ